VKTTTTQKVKSTRGWHGDSAGHAKAGRLGGLKRSENVRKARMAKGGD
jgi:hypothetical protein